MVKSKIIKLFLIDGDPNDRIKCKLSNWDGVIYKIPRSSINKCSSGGDIAVHINQAGIYFLLGEANSGNPSIYIGQANARKNGKALNQRLKEHKNDDDEWNEIIIITKIDDSFDATDLNYLENKFTNLATESGRYEVINKCEPNRGNIQEEKAAELDEFIENCLIIVNILGVKAFEKIDIPAGKSNFVQSKSSEDQYLFNYQGKYKAQALLTKEGMVLLKGSEISSSLAEKVPGQTIKLRKQYSNKISKEFITTDNLLFGSQSAAGSFVSGSSVSGNVVWKNKAGLSPKDV